jgi:hypothetical protein
VKTLGGPSPLSAKVTTRIDKGNGMPVVEYTNVGARMVTGFGAHVDFFDPNGHKKIGGTSSNHSGMELKPGDKYEKAESAGSVDPKKVKGVVVEPTVESVDLDDGSHWGR